jgi:AraC family transcriptional regulator of adaptative response/methylated-DNA-[protein]-cysteine methyltransferase
MTGEGWIVALEFFDDQGILLETLRKDWMQSSFLHDPESTGGVASRLFSPGPMDPLYLLARGTLFQLKVWQALLEIPFGKTVTYEQLARRVNNPGGLQAVGNAIGKNPIAWVIPCHRVIRKSGKISKYRWGTQRKAAMLEWENPAAYKGIWSQAG